MWQRFSVTYDTRRRSYVGFRMTARGGTQSRRITMTGSTASCLNACCVLASDRLAVLLVGKIDLMSTASVTT